MAKTIIMDKATDKRLRFVNEATSNDETRPALGAVNFRDTYAEGTDGFRVHITNLSVIDPETGLPLRGLHGLKIARKELEAELTPGSYPDIAGIMPNDTSILFAVDPHLLASGLKYFDKSTPCYFLHNPKLKFGRFHQPIKILGLIEGEPALILLMPMAYSEHDLKGTEGKFEGYKPDDGNFDHIAYNPFNNGGVK